MPARYRQLILLTVACAAAGCNGNPYLAQQNGWNGNGWNGAPPGSAQQPLVAEMREMQRRLSELDANNSELNAQLAQTHQEKQVYRDQIALLQKQLRDTASQLRETQTARQDVEQRLDGIMTSTRQRGGAIITANSSLTKPLDAIQLPGLEVRQDQDVVRIEIPSDQLFQPGTAALHPNSYALLDQVAAAVLQSYPKQIIGIEGHTDSPSSFGAVGASQHQLTALQSVAVFDQFVQRNRVPSRQLFTVGHGANHPLASNATPAGRAKNRRIEIVVYPETLDLR